MTENRHERDDAAKLRPDSRAPFLAVGDSVEIAGDVVIGAHVTIHAGTRIGPGVMIQDGAVLGKPLMLHPGSSLPRDDHTGAVVGEGAMIGAGAIVVAGARIGDGAVLGDQSFVRERAELDAGVVIGRLCGIGPDVELKRGSVLQPMVMLARGTLVEEDVFIGPSVNALNDNSMARHASGELPVVRIRRAGRVGAGALINPGLEIGEEAFVAAGALLTRDVPRRAKVRGVPARVYAEVTDTELLERWR